MAKSAKDGTWMEKAMAKPSSKGALHRALGVAEGTKIPAKKMAAAKKSRNPKVRKQAQMAANMAKSRGK
jgi:hypothetical protein